MVLPEYGVEIFRGLVNTGDSEVGAPRVEDV